MTCRHPTRLALTALLTGALLAPAPARAQTTAPSAAERAQAIYDAAVFVHFKKSSIVNPMPRLLAGAEIGAPEITPEQRDSIAARHVAFQRTADAAWAALEKDLRDAPTSFIASDIIPTVEATFAAVTAALARETTAAKAILTAEQFRGLPKGVGAAIDDIVERH